jgi:hypothetical protein
MDDFDDIQIEDTINEDLIEWTDEMRALYEREMHERWDTSPPDDHTLEDDRDWSDGNPDASTNIQ